MRNNHIGKRPNMIMNSLRGSQQPVKVLEYVQDENGFLFWIEMNIMHTFPPTQKSEHKCHSKNFKSI